MHEIMPRHFMQTAEVAGVGTSLMRKIFEDIAANAERRTEVVISKLPRHFSAQLVESVTSAIAKRAMLLSETH
jgi:serine/threonine-protein kinase HipA